MREFFRKNRRVLVILLIVAVVASAFIYMRSTRVDIASQYQTAKIERGNLTATIGATGTVRARQTAEIVSDLVGPSGGPEVSDHLVYGGSLAGVLYDLQFAAS